MKDTDGQKIAAESGRSAAAQQEALGAAGRESAPPPNPHRDQPWIFRTYAGHSTAAASNALYRENLARGQTGLSVAFDLPTQTGYDADHPLVRGEVGKVGVPIGHLGDMRALFEGIPLSRMNTSMTINATAPWLMALYIAVADEQGVKREELSGTTQNDILKEYLARGTYIFPPAPSLRLAGDLIAFTCSEVPRWNPVNVCSYHLQEAGATPVQELAFTLANAIALLDSVKARGEVHGKSFERAVGRISFFVNAGLKFVTELCKLRAFGILWDEICRERYGIEDPKLRRFRYGVQVNSLGLTEQQPENNVYRILLEMLAVVLSKDARARAVQLPAWNEALGLPRPWDQQWSLRLQQIVAYETDLLDHDDLFEGSRVIEEKTEALAKEAREELARIEDIGGAVEAIKSAYMKESLVDSNARRLAAIESGAEVVVGVNAFTETAPSPLTAASDGGFLAPDPNAEAEQIARLEAWRRGRDARAVETALGRLVSDAKAGVNIMPASIACARAGVTTGEWAEALRRVFGTYRAPTGVVRLTGRSNAPDLAALQERVDALATAIGHRPRILVGKPGLDGHSNGAEQIASRARDAGFEVVYQGIRLTPEEIAIAARDEKVDLIGLSVLSGSHLTLVEAVAAELKRAGLSQLPLVVGGIIPEADSARLRALGVSAIFTPKDFDRSAILGALLELVARETAERSA